MVSSVFLLHPWILAEASNAVRDVANWCVVYEVHRSTMQSLEAVWNAGYTARMRIASDRLKTQEYDR
jgi:hypothetical protein